ncbi:hypothetical protein K432DRAFT_333939 [Lepidopterella palustris CBS 459.81]|uniref:Uncharacterized protein n=1 Tax=Lepidopterella palustris CBS 459.81 TaxID=1314670 RepID=A0A8E2E4T5_9PEZI|nr:hypothetical protein K432DRAFT_333939 [Lepidopterella palustris CBS 459.81]
MPPLTPPTISLASFNTILSRYPSTVPPKLHDLDELRFNIIPQTLAKRREALDAFLDKAEVEGLVEWKLKHGTFRPKLLALVSSNTSSEIVQATTASFAAYESDPSAPVAASKPLLKLRGIGPATASLVLSVYSPDTIPFFSDELFRWVMWDEGGTKGRGWERKIGYTAKEWEEVIQRVGEVRERLGVSAGECERVAWVLGREGVDVEVGMGAAEEEGKGVDGEGAGVKVKDEKGKKGRKKADASTRLKPSAKASAGVTASTEPLRRSKRKQAFTSPQETAEHPSKPSKRLR